MESAQYSLISAAEVTTLPPDRYFSFADQGLMG